MPLIYFVFVYISGIENNFNRIYVFFQSVLECNAFLNTVFGNNCTLEYSGGEYCIHFSTTVTCAGDEIGWDFEAWLKALNYPLLLSVMR